MRQQEHTPVPPQRCATANRPSHPLIQRAKRIVMHLRAIVHICQRMLQSTAHSEACRASPVAPCKQQHCARCLRVALLTAHQAHRQSWPKSSFAKHIFGVLTEHSRCKQIYQNRNASTPERKLQHQSSEGQQPAQWAGKDPCRGPTPCCARRSQHPPIVAELETRQSVPEREAKSRDTRQLRDAVFKRQRRVRTISAPTTVSCRCADRC